MNNNTDTGYRSNLKSLKCLHNLVYMHIYVSNKILTLFFLTHSDFYHEICIINQHPYENSSRNRKI